MLLTSLKAPSSWKSGISASGSPSAVDLGDDEEAKCNLILEIGEIETRLGGLRFARG
jgi:hypothetical protein